ncbi:hypothetical protein TNCV_421311 [Trichonephila clavipes]|nr:hypothetical protein TNCV_421311 [Trichonephila clavipes]
MAPSFGVTPTLEESPGPPEVLRRPSLCPSRREGKTVARALDKLDFYAIDVIIEELSRVLWPQYPSGQDYGLACYEFEPSAADHTPYRGNRCTFNLSWLSLPSFGVVWKFINVT